LNAKIFDSRGNDFVRWFTENEKFILFLNIQNVLTISYELDLVGLLRNELLKLENISDWMRSGVNAGWIVDGGGNWFRRGVAENNLGSMIGMLVDLFDN